jgi:hypothetical protein
VKTRKRPKDVRSAEVKLRKVIKRPAQGDALLAGKSVSVRVQGAKSLGCDESLISKSDSRAERVKSYRDGVAFRIPDRSRATVSGHALRVSSCSDEINSSPPMCSADRVEVNEISFSVLPDEVQFSALSKNRMSRRWKFS